MLNNVRKGIENKNINLLILGVVGILFLIIIIIYSSYSNIYRTSHVIERFDTPQTMTLNKKEFDENLDKLKKLYTKKYSDKMNKYDSNFLDDNIKQTSIFNYIDKNIVDNKNHLSKQLKLYIVKVYEDLQNKDINELNNLYNQLKDNLAKKQYLLKETKKNEIQHIQSGSKFDILEDPNKLNNNFSIMIDNDSATCLKHHNDIDPNDNNVNNIDTTACDYNPSKTSQKFKVKKISNNNDYNEHLNDLFKLTFDNTEDYYSKYNNYPFYVVNPNTTSDNNECLTLNDGSLTIKPCNGDKNQRFLLNDNSFDITKL